LSNDLVSLEVSASGVQAERDNLAAEQQSVQAQYAQRRQSLQQSRVAVESQLRRADRQQRKLRGGDPDIRRAARSRDAKARALQTYIPFPAEAERDRLLALARD
jgi:hypothetical protein